MPPGNLPLYWSLPVLVVAQGNAANERLADSTAAPHRRTAEDLDPHHSRRAGHFACCPGCLLCGAMCTYATTTRPARGGAGRGADAEMPGL